MMRIGLIAIITAVIVLAGCCSFMQSAQSGTPGQPSAQGCSFTGTWSTTWGEMVLAQDGSNVIGTYAHDDGRINGTVSGATITGSWAENAVENAYQPPDNAGDVTATISSDCNRIEGFWRYGSEGEYKGGWSGTRE